MKKVNYDIDALKKKLRECQSRMSATLEIITPAVALRYLGSNFQDSKNRTKNRQLDNKTLRKYENDMIDDRWEVGPPIMFDTSNKLIDGQHRCTGVIKTGVPIISWVIRGVLPTAFPVIDSGKKRTLKDNLTSLRVNDTEGNEISLTRPSPLGGAINIMHNIQTNSQNVDKDRILTMSEMVDMVRSDFNYYEEPFKGKRNKSKMDFWQKRIKHSISASYLAAFYYLHKKTYGDLVDSFLEVATSNDGTTPVIVRKFRDDILENKNRHSSDKKYLNSNAIMKRLDILFMNYTQDTLNRKKDFTKKDLE